MLRRAERKLEWHLTHIRVMRHEMCVCALIYKLPFVHILDYEDRFCYLSVLLNNHVPHKWLLQRQAYVLYVNVVITLHFAQSIPKSHSHLFASNPAAPGVYIWSFTRWILLSLLPLTTIFTNIYTRGESSCCSTSNDNHMVRIKNSTVDVKDHLKKYVICIFSLH